MGARRFLHLLSSMSSAALKPSEYWGVTRPARKSPMMDITRVGVCIPILLLVVSKGGFISYFLFGVDLVNVFNDLFRYEMIKSTCLKHNFSLFRIGLSDCRSQVDTGLLYPTMLIITTTQVDVVGAVTVSIGRLLSAILIEDSSRCFSDIVLDSFCF